jgi:glycosyltransferase involved in cell wall biosynthesis
MKVVHLSYNDNAGGAARAAFRLHLGLLATGHDSAMLVLRQDSSLPSVHRAKNPRSLRDRLWEKIAHYQIHLNRTHHSGSHFSFCHHGVDLSRHPLIAQADVINLHWVAEYQSPQTIARLQATGIPIVWTLHDQRAFTGGCHYTAGCAGYESACANCPQILRNPQEFPVATLGDSLAWVDPARITVVAPSRWMAECARRSRVFQRARVEVIPYGLETDIFHPQDRIAARAALGLPPDGICILFGADNITDKRKGMGELRKALEQCRADAEFDRKLRGGGIRLISFGQKQDATFAREFQIHEVGYVSSDETMAKLYAAADLFAMPSLEDNLPNMVLEAMSCGRAVAAFAIGGVPDLIEHGVTGSLAQRTDGAAFAETILALLGNPRCLDEMGARARERIEHRHTLAHQATAYRDLYAGLSRTAARPMPKPERSGVDALFAPLLFRTLPGLMRRLATLAGLAPRPKIAAP